MLKLRRSKDRGEANHGWLHSFHSFSFAEYYDPEYIGWGNLRVINEDRVAPRGGFGIHGHRDMEIISYVLESELAHRDSMGNIKGNIKGIPPGDVQRMSAGTGVRHSEFNHEPDRTTHFLQIWIQPNVTGIEPSYEQKTVPVASKRGRLALVASPEGGDSAVRIQTAGSSTARREEREAEARFGDVYRNYAAVAPAFVPRLSHTRQGAAQ